MLHLPKVVPFLYLCL